MTLQIVPESAPFSVEQRAWLNGFLAGMMGMLDDHQARGGSSVAVAAAASLLTPPSGDTSQVLSDSEADEAYPWHDSALPIVDRMKLAEGQSIERRMMAAMAQLDCGTCGYHCKTYAEAIASGAEKSLILCSPGGSETAKLLKQLNKDRKSNVPINGKPASAIGQLTQPEMPSNGSQSPPLSRNAEPALAYSRQNPFPSAAIHVEKLTGNGSAKDTRLVSLSISGSGLNYKVGDALGVFPRNSKEQVEALIKLLQHDGSEPVRTPDGTSTTLRGALSEFCDIKTPSDTILELMLDRTSSKEGKKHLQGILDDEPVEGLVLQPRLIDVVARFPDIRLTVEEIVSSLESLKPRLYSIASSPLVNPNQVDLVVGVVQYVLNGQQRKGVASTFLANRMIGHEPVPIFVQPCHHFGLPADPQTPIIMIGPGTGIAPFRAFLHERKARGTKSENWLFFGDQHEASDFLFKEELHTMQKDGLLTRLSTAFSRDQDERIYVQQRMLESRIPLWQWLERGAHIYVCGDAARMAGDVDRALHEVVRTAGSLSTEAADEYVKNLRKTDRYQRDVY